jgi:hypothetical protein
MQSKNPGNREQAMRIFHQITLVFAVSCIFSLSTHQAAYAQNDNFESCDAYLPRLRQVEKSKVGPQSCMMQEAKVSYKGKDYMRLDIGLDGTVEGYVTKEGDYHEYLTNTPELVFPQAQASDLQQPQLAIAHYEMLRGAAVLMVYPASRRDWNGKLWVTVHGRGRSFNNGSLKTWYDYHDASDPMGEFNKLEKAMLSQGYAIAVTRRTSEESIGEVMATLADGTIVNWVAFNDSHSLIKDYTAVAEAAINRRLGRSPERTYLYGKSAGARLARGMNYFGSRLNTDRNGQAIFDAFLVDDSAAGTWLPVVMKDGRDTLLISEQEKDAFVPQLELLHQAYWNFNNHDLPDFVTYSFLANKYNNARILLSKGLGDKFRAYEIRQLSHDGGSALADGRRGKLQILDLSLLMEGVINIIDNWVEGAAVPPASMSDYPVIGDTNQDGIIESPAVNYPEVACPLGKFYPYPRSGAGATSWAAFTGMGIEPRDEHSVFVDMNDNGLWDFRETPTQAWQRLGLLNHGETLTRSIYVDCVRQAAEKLARQGLFHQETVDAYVERARAKKLLPDSDEDHALIYFSRF